MKKTTIKISHDLFWELEKVRVNYRLKSKDEALRYLLGLNHSTNGEILIKPKKVHSLALKHQKEVSHK